MKAFVIGNAALDETLSVEALPQPGASIFGQALSRDLGGKGVNQAVALARTGLDCTLVAAVGQDPDAQQIAALLAAEPLTARMIGIAGVASDRSFILMSQQGENAVITTRAAAGALPPAAAQAALAGAAPGDLLVMQGNLSAETTQAAFRTARDMGMRTALNPSPMQPYFAALWPLVDSVFLNAGEAAELGGTDVVLAAGAGEVVLTLGAQGARLCRTGSAAVDVPAAPATLVDTTGAGDCFMAVALASAALRGVRLDARALRHGAQAAAQTVGRAGTLRAFPDMAGMRAILTHP